MLLKMQVSSICEAHNVKHKADKGDVPYGECQPSQFPAKPNQMTPER